MSQYYKERKTAASLYMRQRSTLLLILSLNIHVFQQSVVIVDDKRVNIFFLRRRETKPKLEDTVHHINFD